MRTTASTRPGITPPTRNYPMLLPMPYLEAMATVRRLCAYDETKAQASLNIARRIGINAEPAPKGLINITYIAGAFTIENRQS